MFNQQIENSFESAFKTTSSTTALSLILASAIVKLEVIVSVQIVLFSLMQISFKVEGPVWVTKKIVDLTGGRVRLAKQ
jgi:hypothetical protein